MKKVSIVVPVYNEEDNIEHFYEEICHVMGSLPYEFELIFVDDGSKDLSICLLNNLSQHDKRVKPLYLAKNFGHQVALSCGLDNASGDAIITMDGDMQHPPAFLPILLAKWEEGYEVVQTIRKSTEGVSWFKNITSAMFYKLMNIMSKVHIQPGGSDFRLLDKMVVDSFRSYRERARFIRGMIGAIGYKQIQLEFVAPKRFAGNSKFSLRKMLHFALDGITAYSKVPLRLAFYAGVILGFFSIAVTLHVMYIKLLTEDAVPGWATISASILFLGGIELIGLGIIGEYVGRIFEEVKQRPLYLLRKEPNMLDLQRVNDNIVADCQKDEKK